ncbi:tripartite motif-containing protein 2-like, partial [Crassostrea angulata]|uniref:tripartite motif-containing protein 2-like n=1 Tax=Magallana angulata TaxID=2784310 RepID=UPI0022B1686A
FAYKSKNNIFRELHPKITVSLPTFTPHQINTEKMYEQFGFLTALSMKDDENGCSTPVDDAIPPSARPLIDEPQILTEVTTDHVVHDSLVSVCCLRDDEVWTSSYDNILKLYNLNGKLLKSINTRPWFIPCGIALTGCSSVVFGDSFNGTLNIVKDTGIWEVIRLQGWTPHGVCSTSSGDLLLLMVSNDRQEKVVRYSGFAEKQSIQFDDKKQPLYSGSRINYFPKCITENRNLDICVADCEAGAVVVVNHAGKLRFRYTGHTSHVFGVFRPFGIISDSQCWILISDYYNHNIHVVDKDGHFLRYINNCGLRSPRGLCVDSNDNLIVVEYDTGKIKKIKYNY